MSDDSDNENKNGKRRKRPLIPSSSSESLDSGSELAATKRSRKQLEIESEADISTSITSGSSPIARSTQQRKVPVIDSDDDTSISENEEIIAVGPSIRRGAFRVLSDYESGESNGDGDVTDSSESSLDEDDNAEVQKGDEDTKLVDALFESSSDYDSQSEKCPICLAKFNHQEIGTPESCDHYFCAVCIQEWSKNVNTCPVDRQPFTLILVRQHLEGKVIRQIPVSVPTDEPVITLDDATFCEVCGLSDREDRLLLCDLCDHGYHMECLNPPLEYVPIDEWYCPECTPRQQTRRHTRGARDQFPENGDNDIAEPREEEHLPRNRPLPRMVPRTRHAVRVQRNIRNRGSNNATDGQQTDQPLAQLLTSSGVESVEGRGSQRQRPVARRQRRTRRKRRGSKRIKRIVTDDGIIEVVLKRKGGRRKYRKKHKNRTVRAKPRTVKGRLANKLGMCTPRMGKQMIPESVNRQELSNAPINHQRHQAGLPTLDIFGRREQLEYFSGSDGEEDIVSEAGGVGVLSRVRVARPSDRLISRKKAASLLSSTLRKPLKVGSIVAPAGGSLLDSILDSQTLWHSKKTEIKSKSDGSLLVILPSSTKGEPLKENTKIDLKNTKAPVVETPMFPGGQVQSAGTYKADRGETNQRGSRNESEGSYAGTSFQSSGSGGSEYRRVENAAGPAPGPLRGAPIRFRMNVPPKRPNIHSYPTDNIPPPPPLRLRSPLAELSFPPTNSPDTSPAKDEEEIDIYSDIEQETQDNEPEEKTFGALEPPPEPPFLMTMEPPPEPPAILMNLNDDASDDEPSGLVIDDPPPGEAYDPCTANSDDSNSLDAPLAKPPELPEALKDADLVADYSSDSTCNDTSSYNPELPTYSNTAIAGPLPRPSTHHSSEGEENDDECPNFSMYSVESMNLAHRTLPSSIENLNIPIPPTTDKINDIDIPLPEEITSSKIIDEESILDNIPIPGARKGDDLMKNDSEKMSDVSNEDDQTSDGTSSHCEETKDSLKDSEEGIIEENGDAGVEDEEDNKSNSSSENENNDEDEKDGEDAIEAEGDDNDQDDDESECGSSVQDEEKIVRSKSSKAKSSSEAAEDECSTQGDVLDLAIESEANLENNIPHDEGDVQQEITTQHLEEREGSIEKDVDGGDKSDGLVDITDEEMSVYDGHDNTDDLDKSDEQVLGSAAPNGKVEKSLDSDDDNSLIGGATSAVSAGTINNSDNVQPPTLPGLEGLETETISESEDVNFDELPLEGSEQQEVITNDENRGSSAKKKKKKNRKVFQTEGSTGKGSNEPLEFEEGEIIDDKPKPVTNKKDKKTKQKSEDVIEVDENVDANRSKVLTVDKDGVEKKIKKKKGSANRDKSDKIKEIKEKTVKAGIADENVSWKKLSKSTKVRNYRDTKDKEEKDKGRENKSVELSKKEKRNKERRKELERYDVRRLISEKPKRPKKDEFGRDISPSKSGSSLSPYRPPKYRSPLRTRNRSRTRSRSWRSRSRSRGRKRRSRSRDRIRSHDRSRKSRSRERRASRSRNKAASRSRERRRDPDKNKSGKRSLSRTRRKSRSHSPQARRRRSLSYSRSWTPSWSKSSRSRSRTPQRRKRQKSISRSKSRSWTRDQNPPSSRRDRMKDPPKNLTVIVTNKEALKKKEKKKTSKKRDDRRKKKRGQSPAPSKEVFTSGDNILVSVNFKNANKNPEIIPASTPLLRESTKRKRDDPDGSAKKKKVSSSKKSPGVKKSNRLARINEVAKNAKPVAIIDLDLSPFREQTPSPREVIILSDSGDEGDKQLNDIQSEIDRMSHKSVNQSMMSLSSIEHGQKNSMSQPESPLSSSFILNSSGPKTPPEPHIKFSISTKPSQIRIMNNPLLEAEEEMHDEHLENEVDEILHKGPNTPPEPPPDLNTPASPPTTPYDPFDPTKSRSPSPQPRGGDVASQLNTSREDKLDNLQNDNDEHPHLAELRATTPQNELEDMRKTPESLKLHSTPKADHSNTDTSPKVSPPTGLSEPNKLPEDTLMKPIQKLLSNTNKVDVAVHKSPEKLVTVVISQQVKNTNQTPKQPIQPLKAITPNKTQTPKGNVKHQLFSSSLLKQIPILGTLPLLSGAPTYTPMGINSNSKPSGRIQQNGDPSDDMDIDPSSPYSPGSSEGDDLFEPPIATPPRSSSKSANKSKPSSGNKFDALFGSPAKPRHGRHQSKAAKKGAKSKSKGSKKEEVKVKLDEDQLKILDELPSSAVEMQFLKKLNRQERVVEEVKLVLKPHYAKKHINKEEYKEILRRSVPKICHNKSGEINPIKIQFLIEAYVKKFRYAKKKASGTAPAPAQNKPKPQKSLWS